MSVDEGCLGDKSEKTVRSKSCYHLPFKIRIANDVSRATKFACCDPKSLRPLIPCIEIAKPKSRYPIFLIAEDTNDAPESCRSIELDYLHS